MIENTIGFDRLPEGRKEAVQQIREAVAVTTVAENNFVPQVIKGFSDNLRQRFPEANFKQIPEYQTLVGGSEEMGVDNDKELEREIVDEITRFAEELLEQKAKLRSVV